MICIVKFTDIGQPPLFSQCIDAIKSELIISKKATKKERKSKKNAKNAKNKQKK